jgi:hypothetical protein
MAANAHIAQVAEWRKRRRPVSMQIKFDRKNEACRRQAQAGWSM